MQMPNITQEVRDNSSPVWDMSQERVLIITMLNQRFQFFLLFFSLVIAGALNARAPQHMSIVLFLGTTVSWLVAFTLFRTQIRHNKILYIIEQDETHPYTVINKLLGGRFRIQYLLSYVIPIFCCLSITIGTVLSLTGYLVVVPRG